MDENKKSGDAFGDFSIDDILKSIETGEQKKEEKNDESAEPSVKSEQKPAFEEKTTPISMGKAEIKGSLFDELKRNDAAKKNEQNTVNRSGETCNVPAERRNSSESNHKNKKASKEKKQGSAVGGIIRGAVIVVISVIIAGIILFLISDVTGIGKEVFKGSDSNTELYITVEEGTPSIRVYEELAQKGVICNAKVFQLYLKVTGKNPSINYGKHQFTKSMSYDKIISVLEETSVHAEDISVTVRPGATVEDIGAALEKAEICKADSFIKEVQKGASAFTSTNGILDSIPDDSDIYYQLEGYLFPETYKFYRNDDPHDVVQKMIDTLAENFTPELQKKAADKGYTVHEILTLASVVQLEAGDAKTSDMKKVAQVFYNRLEKWDEGGRFLQSDPTMKYQHNSDAYNTYKSEGLPPGPLCSMNFNVIKACLDPDTTCTAFYFVTDKSMNFYFNDTIDGHTKTINDLISRGMWAE